MHRVKRGVMKASAYQNTQPSIGYTFRYYATQMKGQSFVEDVGYVPLYKTISANDARLLYK
ncbi:hypothetical protein A5606_002685 [Salmonella enterica subsp. enterica serovar Oakland]|nr:hypothetical protein [Salmonella enterica subsp. enterica serovar Oakland]